MTGQPLSSSTLYSLTYMSAATRPFQPEELADLLSKSRVRNSERGLTGMLLHKGNSFIQVLEGERAAVDELYARIARDPRHERLIIIKAETITTRSFPSWKMGYRALDASSLPPGFSSFLDSLGDAELGVDLTQAQRLLVLFKETM